MIARADEAVPTGAVFMAFCYYEAAVNKLSHAALDPAAKIPEFKYCAVKISKGGEPMQFYSYGGGQSDNKLN
jgi:formate dehydrogenase major subunit